MRLQPLSPLAEAVLVALVVAGVYLLVRVSPYLAAGAFHDDGVYLAVGRSLAEGHGYRSLYAIGEPVHAKYPPALPVLYAILWMLLSDLERVHQAAIFLSLLATAGAAGGVWWLARARMALSLPVALVFATGPFLMEASIQYFNLAISEPYFMLLWAVALILFWRLSGVERSAPPPPSTTEEGDEVTPSASSPGVGLPLLLGAALAAATLFRSQGIVLIPTALLALLLVRVPRRSFALCLATAGLPVAVWKLWHRYALLRGPVGTQPDEGAYVSWTPNGPLGERIHFLADVVRSQFTMYGRYMPPHLSGSWWFGMALWLVFLVLVVGGTWRSWRRHPDLVLTALCSAGVIFLWPWWQDRFVLALLPFLGLLAGAEAERWARACPRSLRPAGYGVLALVAGMVAIRQVEIRTTATTEEGQQALFFHPSYYLRANTAYLLAVSRWIEGAPADVDLLAPLPVGIWLYTGHRVVNATPSLPDVGPSVWDVPGRFLAQRVVEDDPDLLAIWALNENIARDASVVQGACPEALEYLGFTPEYTRVALYRIHPEDACFSQRFLEPARRELEEERAAQASAPGRRQGPQPLLGEAGPTGLQPPGGAPGSPDHSGR